MLGSQKWTFNIHLADKLLKRKDIFPPVLAAVNCLLVMQYQSGGNLLGLSEKKKYKQLIPEIQNAILHSTSFNIIKYFMQLA